MREVFIDSGSACIVSTRWPWALNDVSMVLCKEVYMDGVCLDVAPGILMRPETSSTTVILWVKPPTAG